MIGVARDGVADRGEVEDVREVAFLEDPDEGAEARGDRQQGHHDRLRRDDDRAEQQEQDQTTREQGQPDGPRGARLGLEEVVAGCGVPPTGRDAVAGVDRADRRDEVRRRRLRRRDRADRVEADRSVADVLLAERVEARWLLVRRQGVQRGNLLRRQLGAGLRVAHRERALDPVDAIEPNQLIAVGVERGDGLDRRGRARNVGQDDDRRRLAGGEFGVERDVRVAALEAGRVDLRAGHTLSELEERDAGQSRTSASGRARRSDGA